MEDLCNAAHGQATEEGPLSPVGWGSLYHSAGFLARIRGSTVSSEQHRKASAFRGSAGGRTPRLGSSPNFLSPHGHLFSSPESSWSRDTGEGKQSPGAPINLRIRDWSFSQAFIQIGRNPWHPSARGDSLACSTQPRVSPPLINTWCKFSLRQMIGHEHPLTPRTSQSQDCHTLHSPAGVLSPFTPYHASTVNGFTLKMGNQEKANQCGFIEFLVLDWN